MKIERKMKDSEKTNNNGELDALPEKVQGPVLPAPVLCRLR
jgi:hypothetical protein